MPDAQQSALGGGSPTADGPGTKAIRSALLRQRVSAMQQRAAAAGGAIPRRAGGAPSLSYAQERLLLTERLTDQASLYHVPFVFRLSGIVHPWALERALTEVVRRHEVLRTVFPERDGRVVPLTTPPAPVPVECSDVRDAQPDQRLDRALTLVSDFAGVPFDLVAGPLVRGLLVRWGVRKWVFVLVAHHIVVDGWSVPVLWDELGTVYAALVEGREPELVALPVQYSDFAVWQREWLAGGVLDEQLGYWRDRLRGLEAVRVPVDRPRPLVRSGRGAVVEFELSAELTGRLRGLAGRCGATVFMVLLAAWCELLCRVGGDTDIAVGTPVAGRGRPELERMIGFFVNTLVVRVDGSGDPSFVEMIARVREAAVGAFAHQEVPFERLVEELAPRREASGDPFFQVVFSFDEDGPGVPLLPGVEVTPVILEVDQAKFELAVGLAARGDRIVGHLNYAVDLFDRPTVARLADHYTRLLTLATGNPRRSLADHDLLTTNERRQLLRQGGGDPVDGPQPFVHELVMAQAARTPDAEAVRTETESLTYQELDRRAEAVSRSLRALGLGPENVVGVMVDRSPHLVTAMLAVLRTGAALLMIDLTYPAERIHRMLTLARADAVLAEPSPALAGVPDTVRVMDIDSGGTPPPGAARPAHRTLLAGNTACVVFTSGSTGEPKGAMITHAALTNTIVDGWRRLQLTASDTVGAVASPAFDVALFEILGALAHGARLVLLPREAASDGERLAEAVDRHHITVVDVTPTTASTLPERWHAPGLRLASGGEELSAELARSLTARLAGVWNVYGPAEATINTTVHRLRAPVAGDLVPLGRPVRGATVRVLSERAGLVPIGVPGELFIGGIGLSRGYVSRPALTAERFVPDPFGPPGARMYRTGDAAAWRPDGSLVFLGRRDQQVKVRGQRLETGEVEAALTRHPAVAHALVTAQGGQLDRRLAGYVVWRPGLTVPWADLRGFLRESLPEYMVPVVFTALERLPRTSSGKVDRRALPEIPLGPAGRTYAAPRDDIEELVASVWADVLGVDRVGRDDNFFELGGHSLRVARVVASLRKARDVELPLRALFERPVLSDFADLVRTRDGGPERTRIPRRPAGVTVPLSAVQRRLWFLHNLDPTRSDYNSYFLLSLSGAVEESAFSGALSRLVDRHEILRARIGGAADAPTLVVGSSGEFTLDSADVSHLPAAEAEAEARRLALRFAGVPFDLVAGPLVRGLLVRWGVRKWVFVLVAHHIVVDGWSVPVLWDELGTVYAALVEGREPELVALPVQYSDFAVWQREWLAGGVLDEQLGYWRDRLRGLEAVRVPVDRPRPLVRSGRGAVVEFELSAELTGRLRGLAGRCGATVFMVLLAAWCELLCRVGGDTDIAVGTPVAGRGRPELERMIGFFVNTLVVRVDGSGDPSFVEMIARVREAAVGAFAHQEVPFERLVEELAPRREASGDPFFQVVFSFDEDGPGVPLLPGVEVTPVILEVDQAKFELAVGLAARGDRIVGHLNYAVDLFDRPTVARLADHYTRLLTLATGNPRRSLADHDLLTTNERRQLLNQIQAGRRL